MNIKEHIEAGHYERDEKGRALVPMRNGRTATIYATDYATHQDDEFPLLAGYGREPDRWRADGCYYGGHPSDRDLLPPPPRKVPLRAWMVVYPGGSWSCYDNECQANVAATANPSYRVVPVAGEYEEPWS